MWSGALGCKFGSAVYRSVQILFAPRDKYQILCSAAMKIGGFPMTSSRSIVSKEASLLIYFDRGFFI